MSKSYAEAGVNVEAGYELVSRIKDRVSRTFDDNVLQGLGSFGAMYALPKELVANDPVLVTGTDGVGTKLVLSNIMDDYRTIGIDCVAMCVNDIICHGAKPLFFLDYLASGKLSPEKMANIVDGIARGCEISSCSLVGGETAEMPGIYAEEDYDIAGFVVGVVDRKKLIDGSKISAGDALIGLGSSGVHSNGFSLVRKIFRMDRDNLKQYIEDLGQSLGETLLTPTRIYANAVMSCVDAIDVHGIAHITGGGFIENIPRMMPKGLTARVRMGSWPILPIFKLMQQTSEIAEEEMFNIFNMGIGMVLAVSKKDADAAMEILRKCGEQPYLMGDVITGSEELVLV